MFLTPNLIVIGARALLVIAAIVGLLCLRALGGEANPPLWLMLAAGACAVPLLAIAFPWHRRADLLKGVLAFSGAVAASRLLGQPHALADALGLAGGALIAFVALHAEGMRRDARDYGNLRLDIIAIERRRQARARPGYSAKRGRKATRDEATAAS